MTTVVVGQIRKLVNGRCLEEMDKEELILLIQLLGDMETERYYEKAQQLTKMFLDK